MPTLYHPTLPDVSYEVEPGAVVAWQAQGWLKSAPKAAVAPVAKKAAAPRRRAAPRARAAKKAVPEPAPPTDAE